MTGYREIAATLREAIEAGEYRPGDTIPKLEELQQQYNVGRETARRAVSILRAQGLVIPVRRRGTVVRDRTPVRLHVTRHQGLLTAPGTLGPWESACAEQGLRGRTDLIEVARHTAPALEAGLLEIPAGSNAVRRIQHMFINDEVGQIQQTWLPLRIAADTALESPGKLVGGVYRALAGLGHHPRLADQLISARMPTREEAEIMNLDLGAPVITVDRITRDATETVIAVARAVMVADRITLSSRETYS